MKSFWNPLSRLVLAASLSAAALLAVAHGDVIPQPVDTKGLTPLGDGWRTENPYRGNELARKIGESGYAENCARCHGLQVVSGGIAPDLRKLDKDCAGLTDAAKKASCVKDIDGYFITRIRHGFTRNGAVYMPHFEGILSQEAMWAIKTYLESRREKPL